MKNAKIILAALAAAALCASCAFTAEWRQKKEFSDNFGASVEITATYYAAEFVEKQVMEQANKNLWTEDEAEDYRYNLIQQLKLDDSIPVFVKFKNRGPAIRANPFESQVKLTIGKNRLRPIGYDRRFNFKITDEREGFIYFPRFNEKGEPYLTPKVKTIVFEIEGAISPVTNGKTLKFFWDVKDDNPDKLIKGKAGARIELDRLTKRMQKLSKEGQELQTRLDAIQEEMKKINERMMEISVTK